MALRLTWVDPGFSMDVFLHDADPALIDASAARADVFVVVGVHDDARRRAPPISRRRPHRGGARCGGALAKESRVAFQPVSEMRAMEAKLVPWGQANKDLRLMEQVTGLFERENHLDLLFLHMLLLDAGHKPLRLLVDINQDLNVGNVWCIAKNCNKQLFQCYQNDRCVKSLDCIDACGLNDQVCTYTCIRSYQNDQFQLLARCMLHKNNCLGNDAVRPALPEVLPMTTFRGEPLTHEAAERIMQGWYGDGPDSEPYSWLAVAGQNPAYDHFPCQYQIWYRGKARTASGTTPCSRCRRWRARRCGAGPIIAASAVTSPARFTSPSWTTASPVWSTGAWSTPQTTCRGRCITTRERPKWRDRYATRSISNSTPVSFRLSITRPSRCPRRPGLFNVAGLGSTGCGPIPRICRESSDRCGRDVG